MFGRKFEIDMCEGSIFKNTILFAIPLILASVLQLLYNAADLVVVSRYAGSDAMASVGATSAVTNLLVNVFVGFSLGAGVVVARKYGARDDEGIHKSVHTAMLLGVIVGALSALLGLVFCKPLLVLMGTPEGEVLNGAVLYMRIIFIGVPASLVYNFGASILRAIGDTKRPLYILAFTGLVNVILNLVLVIAFNMDVSGVAIATVVSNYLSALAVLYTLINSDTTYRLNLKHLRFYKNELTEIVKIGLPAGIQSSFFSFSNTIIQSTINTFGEAAIAGNAAGANIEGFVYVAMNAFYQATMTSVSQNYGAKNKTRINKAIYVPLLCVVVTGAVLGVITVVLSRTLLGIYITDSAYALDFGVRRMLITCLPYFLCGVMEVLTGALRGLGYSTIAAISTFVGVCGFRMIWVFAVLPHNRQVEFLFLCWPISWLIVNVLHTITLIVVKPRALKRMQ